jgi:DNA-binding phage protein
MSELDRLKRMLADRNLRAVARGAGIHPNALYRLMSGASQPKYETVRKVLDYLKGQDNDQQA